MSSRRVPYISATLAAMLSFSAAVLGTLSASPVSDSVIGRLHLDVVPDLPERVAKFKRVDMPFNSEGLSPREIKLVEKLVHASGLLDCIYWRQSDPDALYLYKELIQSPDRTDQMLARYIKINGSRFDLIDDNKPFLGVDPMPPGRGFLPKDMTRASFDALVAKNPDMKDRYFSPFTVIQPPVFKSDTKRLSNVRPPAPIPYHKFVNYTK